MMKKILNFALLSTLALTGTWIISACSSADDTIAEGPQGTNGNNGAAAGEVFVDFVFNVSTANEPTTRMTAANTQADLTQSFRGITNAYLGAFSQTADNKHVSDANLTAKKLHELGPVVGAGKLNPNAEASGDVTQSRRVL